VVIGFPITVDPLAENNGRFQRWPYDTEPTHYEKTTLSDRTD
jgi:hypothetical protein